MNVIEHHLAVFDAGRQGALDGLGLLVDLLEHEVLVAALFGGGDVPVDVLGDLVHRVAEAVIEAGGVFGEDDGVAVVEIDHIPGVFQDGRHVGGNEVLPLAKAEDQRALFLDRDHGAGQISAEDAQGVAALHLAHRAAHRPGQVMEPVVVVFDQVGRHLSVGFGDEMLALLDQHLFELEIVFHNAVVHHGDFAGIGQMGVAVDIRGCAVGGPAGVADALAALNGPAAVNHAAEIGQPALGLGHLEAVFCEHTDAGGVIASVLQLFQSFQQDGRSLTIAEISYNSTHIWFLQMNLVAFSCNITLYIVPQCL